MGALNSNIFIVGRLTVAAANKKYIPSIFGYIGKFRSHVPNSDRSKEEPKFDAPFNALILNTILVAIYILASNFRALLTFIGLAQCNSSCANYTVCVC